MNPRSKSSPPVTLDGRGVVLFPGNLLEDIGKVERDDMQAKACFFYAHFYKITGKKFFPDLGVQKRTTLTGGNPISEETMQSLYSSRWKEKSWDARMEGGEPYGSIVRIVAAVSGGRSAAEVSD